MKTIVIIGGGHAAAQLCAALAEGNFTGRVVLVSEELHLPYHRPPLSKTLIKDAAALLPELRGAAFYAQSGVELRLGQRAVRIDRAARQVVLQAPDGGAEDRLAYDHLVLATGSRARHLPGVPEDLPNLHTLRNFDDAVRLRSALSQAQRLMVIGGGFIGLELAASARALGKAVTLIEAAPRLLARAVSPAISRHLLDHHRAAGVDVRLGSAPQRVVVENDRFTGVVLNDESLAADLLLVGIGARPEVSLAEVSGLDCSNGIRVDPLLQTSDPDISAIGDCTTFPYGADATSIRLESVQNANDQAKALAARLLGQPVAYAPVPWFWSEQGDVRLQIAGLWHDGLRAVTRAGAKAGSFSIAHYDGTQFVAMESINAPLDHMTARRWLQQQHSPAPEAFADAARPLKDL
jgi:3-phenylpropionate/trans-cinnamate dioxygenase ferredoxin reductase subunit